jgi:hypothetical protein
MRFCISPFDRPRGPTRAAALCAAVATCLALPAIAGEPPVTGAQKATKAAETDTSNAGMRVAVDPATGRMRPMTANEAKALDALDKANAKRPAAGAPRAFTTASGAIGMELDPSHMVYSVATVGADGKVQMECVTGEEHAHDAAHDQKHTDTNFRETSNEVK